MTIEMAFAGHGLDRADNLRGDEAAMAELRGRDDARLLKMEGLAPILDEQRRLVWEEFDGAALSEKIVFLGLDLSDNGAPLFAPIPKKGDNRTAFEQRISWQAIGKLSPQELAIYGGARSLVDWHARHQFCANCGGPTKLGKGGWQRDCLGQGADSDCKAQHFPRTDPVAIMLVEHEGSLLLGRGLNFPEGRFSALAGFIEPGESVEQGVAREVLEEVGVTLRDVTYIASQPWPFPSQLMMGCHGFAESRDLTIDKTEIDDARWFTREQVAEAMANGDQAKSFLPPPPTAIAHYLLKHWLEQA